jgi:hypothetical protein
VHVQLIQSLREFDMHDELETARQKMLENYPLTESKYFDAWALDARYDFSTRLLICCC